MTTHQMPYEIYARKFAKHHSLSYCSAFSSPECHDAYRNFMESKRQHLEQQKIEQQKSEMGARVRKQAELRESKLATKSVPMSRKMPYREESEEEVEAEDPPKKTKRMKTIRVKKQKPPPEPKPKRKSKRVVVVSSDEE